jgi:rod shape determining protein RodA
MIDRQHIKNIDWPLIILVLVNCLVGVAFIYSSSRFLAGDYFLRQMFWIAFSLILMFVLISVDYRTYSHYAGYVYILGIIIFIGMLLFGEFVAGTKSWIRLFFFQVQPSEFMKIILILILAKIFSKYEKNYLTLSKGIESVFIVALPFFLVALQPDMGTAFGYIPLLLAALFLAGLRRNMVILLVVLCILMSLLVWNFGLKDYQKERLITVISPEKDPLGTGYHIIQSKIAIGSGGLFGKGFSKGTQSQLRFLPARHTDFIFSVIGEELGFLGVIGALFLYLLLLWRLFRSVEKTCDRTGAYIVFMVSVMLASQFFINVFMTIGLFPITGIPLPFFSYGGSSLLTNFMAISLVVNVKMRRFAYL